MTRLAGGYLLYWMSVALIATSAVAVIWTLTRPVTGAAPPLGHQLVQDNPHGINAPIAHGGVVTDGFEVLRLEPGAQPVRITGIRLLEAHDATLVGTVISGPHRKAFQFTVVRGFPAGPGHRGRSAIGATLTPARRGWGLLLGVKVASTGYSGFHGVEVEYTSDGKTFRQVLQGVLVVCADTTPRGRKCEPPAGLQTPAPIK